MTDQNSLNEMVKSRIEDGVGIISLNRPDTLNALDPKLFSQLIQLISTLDRDPQIGCLILTGEGRAFCAGADINYMAETNASAEEIQQFLENFDQVSKTNKPLIACVNGAALGGGFELALACDMILAYERAFFSFPEVGLGLLPGGGGTQRVTRVVGKQRAMEMILTNKRITANEGLEMGFVNKVCTLNNLLTEGLTIGRQIGKLSPKAVLAAKKLIIISENTDLEKGLDYEKQLFVKLLNSDHGREGVKAFIEKRQPDWKK